MTEKYINGIPESVVDCLEILESVVPEVPEEDDFILDSKKIIALMQPFKEEGAEKEKEKEKEKEWRGKFKIFIEQLGLSIGVFSYLDHYAQKVKLPFYHKYKDEDKNEDDTWIPYNQVFFKGVLWKGNTSNDNDWKLFIAARNYIDRFYRISRQNMCCFENENEHSEKIKSEYSVWASFAMGVGVERPADGYVDYGECVAFQLMWRYMHYFDKNDKNDKNDQFDQCGIEKDISDEKCQLRSIFNTLLDAVTNNDFLKFHDDTNQMSSEEKWKKDVNYIFFDDKKNCNMHFKAFCKYIDELCSKEKQECLQHREKYLQHKGECADVNWEKSLSACIASLLTIEGIGSFKELHDKARFPIAPYYYWNAMCKQHLTHFTLPIWREVIRRKVGKKTEEKERVTCVGLAAIRPLLKNDRTLGEYYKNLKKKDDATNNDLEELEKKRKNYITRTLVNIGRRYVGKFLYLDDTDKITRLAVRNAATSIMGRNMSHNIGSHVLARYATEISKAEQQRTVDGATDRDKEDHRTIFLNYLQRRMDFIADVSTSDKSYWSQTFNLGNILAELNYEKQRARIKGDERFEPIILKYIAAKDKITSTVEFTESKQSVGLSFSCPSGVLGTHALYTILENIIRNSARHGGETNSNEIKIIVEVVDNVESLDLFKIKIIDENSSFSSVEIIDENSSFSSVEIIDKNSSFPSPKESDKGVVGDINVIIKTPMADKEKLFSGEGFNAENWGIREMYISAHYLRGFALTDLDENLNLDENENVKERLQNCEVLQAFPEPPDSNGQSCLAYTIYLQRPKQCWLIADIENHEALTKKQHKILNKAGIFVENDLTEEHKNQLHKFDFIVLPSCYKKKDLALPVRTIFYDEPSCIQELLDFISSYAEAGDAEDGDEANFDEKFFMETLHEHLWKGYRDKREKWKGKGLDVLVGWDDEQGELLVGDNGDIIYTHIVKGDNDSDYAKHYDDKNDCKLGMVWASHCSKTEFDERAKLPICKAYIKLRKREYQIGHIIYGESFSSISIHRQMLAEQKQQIELAEQKQQTKIEKILGNELIAAALPRVLILDERVQSNYKKTHRGLEFNKIWPCAGILVPNPDEKNYDVNLNSKIPCYDGIKKYLRNPAEKTEQYPIDFVVIHLSLLERFSDECNGRNQDTILDELFPVQSNKKNKEIYEIYKNCNIIFVTGRGASKVEVKRSNIRYLPISAILEYLITQPSKLGLMRVLWSAMPVHQGNLKKSN